MTVVATPPVSGASAPNTGERTGLLRRIRRWDLVALVLNCVVGAGIMGLPSRVFALAGTYSLVAYLVCAIVVGLIALDLVATVLTLAIGSEFLKK